MSQKKQHNKIFVSTYETPNYPSGFEPVIYQELDNIDDGALDEIFITDLLDNFPDYILSKTLESICYKLKIGGILHIQSLDFEQFNWYVASRALDLNNKNMLYDNRSNVQTMSSIEKLLNDSKINIKIITKKYMNGIEYYFKIEKVDGNG